MPSLRNPCLDNPMGRLPTSFVNACDADEIRRLASHHGIPFNEAVRQILALYLRQPFPLSSKRMGDSKTDRLPEMVAPLHVVEGVSVLALSLGHTRGEVLRQIIRGTLRKHHGRHWSHPATARQS